MNQAQDFGAFWSEALMALSIKDVCRVARIGRTAVYGEIKCGRLRAVKSGRRTLILRDDLLSWLKRLPAISPAISRS